jgi:Mor family transcriptional regulator
MRHISDREKGKNDMELNQQLRIEEFPPIYQTIAKLIGLEKTICLGKELGGDQIYFPRLDFKAVVKARNRLILQDRNEGTSIKTLAEKHNLTQRQIYTIIKKERQTKGRTG